MGYYSQNRCEVFRTYGDKREVVARVFCDELNRWKEQRFGFEQLELAFTWVLAQMNQLSM